MERIQVLQSFHESAVTGWVGRCVASVRTWCDLHDYEYQQCRDDLFDRLPGWYRAKVGGRKPIAADLARLLWIRDELDSGAADIVAWVDADVLVLQPRQLDIAVSTTCVFGQEYWVQEGDGKLRIRKNVHNAYCAFRVDCPILPFLIEAVQRMVRRVDTRFMAPQFVGPKLLTHLHNTVGFELDPRFGALSPSVVDGLLTRDETAYQLMLDKLPAPLMAANLCASLQGGARSDADMERLIERLLR